MSNNKFYKCNCGAEALEIDSQFYKDEKEIYISMWKMGNYHHPLSFWEKIRWMIHIWKTGKPWTDQVCLKKETIKELIKDLEAIVNE